MSQATEKSFDQIIDTLGLNLKNKIALEEFDQEKILEQITYSGLRHEILSFSEFLTRRNVPTGSRVVILSENKINWSVAAFGVIRAGLVCVPLDPTLEPYEIVQLLNHSEPELILVSKNCLPKLRAALSKTSKSNYPIMCLDEHKELPSLVDIPQAPQVFLKHKKLDKKRLALIIYTSGTLGFPKGVMIETSAIIFQLEVLAARSNKKDDRHLLIIPPNHLFGFTVGLALNLYLGVTVTICMNKEPSSILAAMQKGKPTTMTTVPLFLTLVRRNILKAISESSIGKKITFKLLFLIATLTPIMSFRKNLFKPIHEKFGGNLRSFYIGSAPITRECLRFFEKIGITMLEGYGLTETGPVVSGNFHGHIKAGSVGLPIENTIVKIDRPHPKAKEGEILVKGPHLFGGYWKARELTNEVMDSNGFFHTGDLGYLDERGNLYISGRIKKMIVLEGGKKVIPEELEALFMDDHLINEIVFTGHQFKTPNGDITTKVVAAAIPNPNILNGDIQITDEQIKAYIKGKCKVLAPFKRPSEILIFKEEFPKTSIRKIRYQEAQKRISNALVLFDGACV